ncbi:hypothetical protein BJD20_16015 [Acinetobacter proteolyticus]|uniref:hypothetical protein n=1 Tax=Acinetobacter proteolyticus TaxID=1776741 RepID=UPI00086340B3|nr:hypothetical protein [Acinetobacter proteolyticus]OEY95237.1 hypothetical protein BJD20_16015 [Acinetobacter proteolyticus]
MKKIVLSLLIVLLTACSKPEGDRNSNEKSTIQTQEKSSEKVDDLFLGYWKNKGTPDLRNKLLIEIRENNGGYDMSDALTGEFLRNLQSEGNTLTSGGETPLVFSLRENNSELKVNFVTYERISKDQFDVLKKEKDEYQAKCGKLESEYRAELSKIPQPDIAELFASEEDKKKVADINAKYAEIQKANPECNILK